MAVKPEIVDYVNSHTEMVISEAKEILGTITNKEVEIEFQEIVEFDFDKVSAVFSDSVVGVDFKLESDPDGIFHMFIDKATAARIGSLMMMMDEEEAEFTEEHVDAMKETANQVFGAIATKMKSTEDVSVSVADLNGQEVELSADMFDKPDLLTATFTLKIGDDEPKNLVNVLTSSSIETLLDGAAAAETQAEDGAEAETEVEEETAAVEAGEETAEAAEEGEPAAEGEAAEEDEEAGEGEPTAEGEADEEAEEGEGEDEFDISGMLDEEHEDVEAAVEERAEAPAVPAIPVSEADKKFEFLMDLTFPVSIELGRTKMLIKDILDLGHGSVIEFEKLAGEPVDLLVEDKKIAEGEVVVVDEHFGIRITHLVHKAEVIKALGQGGN